MGGVGVCMPVFVPSDPSSLLLSIHHHHSHTYGHCTMFAITLWYKSTASLPIQTCLHGKKNPFHHVLAGQENRCFTACFLLMWTFRWTLHRQKSLTRMYMRRETGEAGLCLYGTKLNYGEEMLMWAIRTHSYVHIIFIRHKNSICTCAVSACLFPTSHGCLSQCHMLHLLFFPSCIFTINLKISKESHRPSYH